MAKGNIAKIEVEKKIASIFGEDYIGNIDKKLYVWANDGSEKVQIAITLTCPKVFVESNKTASSEVVEQKEAVSVEISEEEKENIANLLAKFGL